MCLELKVQRVKYALLETKMLEIKYEIVAENFQLWKQKTRYFIWMRALSSYFFITLREPDLENISLRYMLNLWSVS